MKEKDFEIYKTLVISTAHLTEELAEEMECENILHGRDKDKTCVLYWSDDYGFRVWVRPLKPKEVPLYYPEVMVPVILKAMELGCRWVEYDMDGDVREEFEEFEW